MNISIHLVPSGKRVGVHIGASQKMDVLSVHTSSNPYEGTLTLWSADPQAVLVALRDAASEALKEADAAEAAAYADSELGGDPPEGDASADDGPKRLGSEEVINNCVRTVVAERLSAEQELAVVAERLRAEQELALVFSEMKALPYNHRTGETRYINRENALRIVKTRLHEVQR
jgi:hypothetical protein